MPSDLSPFFNPRGVAILGASTSPAKLSYGILRNLTQYGYAGHIAPVNPKADEILGVKCYPSLASVPDPIDLAVIVLPAEMTLKAVDECGQRGIQAAVIISGGFKEIGPQGAVLEEQVAEIARQYSMRLIGPNCVGVLDMTSGLNVTFIQGRPARGGIGFVSQSGAVAGGVVDTIRDKEIGFSNFSSLGNELDVTETDMIVYLRSEPYTRVIAAYIEMIRDGRRFIEVARQTTPQMPIVMLKAGRTQDGARAVSSHTGSLAGTQAAYQAAFVQSGVIEVETISELLEIAQAFETQPLPAGKRVALVTNGGGPAALVSDSLASQGLTLANLSDSTRQTCRQALHPAAQVDNPIDMLGGARPDEFNLAISTLLEDDGVDAVIAILVPQALVNPAEVAEAVVGSSKGSLKPVLTCFMGDWSVKTARQILHQNGIPMYTTPESLGKVLGALVRYADWRKRPQESMSILRNIDKNSASLLLQDAAGQPAMGEVLTRPLLNAYGIKVVPGGEARSLAEARQVAKQAGYPVAMKIMSADILHKSDAGGITLNIQNDNQLENAYHELMQRVQLARPDAHLEGVLVEAMAPRGQEVIIGMRRDPTFGPLMMFGLGGIAVELFGDVAFRVAPLTRQDAMDMIQATRAGKLLSGFRGKPVVLLDGIIDAMLRLSQLALDFNVIEEIEVNPLLVLPSGDTLALDGRVIFAHH